ncbi:MAG: glycosyltransferase N-terminal domain-containing protein [Hyphomicrobiaceae bacterium]
MADTKLKKPRINNLIGRMGAQYIRLVRITSRTAADTDSEREKAKEHHPCIYAFWHGQFMMIPALKPTNIPVANIVARHGDADLIGAALSSFDMELIRGSGAGGRRKNRGGAHALREAVRALRRGSSVAMTADVPPGPARCASIGVIKLAQLSGRPIIPLAVASSRFHALRTWSRMTLNLPFSTLGVVVGEPIFVGSEADDQTLELRREQLENRLNAATAAVYDKVGGDVLRATPTCALPENAPPQPDSMRLSAYRAATRLGQGVAPLLLRYRARQGKEDPQRSNEKLGYASRERPRGPLVWLHAASVGETNAVLPLIKKLQTHRPSLQFLLTTGTVTSAKIADERLGDCGVHQFAPLDMPQAVARFLDHWRPGLIILTESEIWPNTIVDSHARSIPIAIVNARMSDRSYRRWKKQKGLAHSVFGRLKLILAQSEKLRRQFVDLGSRDVRNAGNLKIDAPILPIDQHALSEMRVAVENRTIWVAASTHPGEEKSVIAAHHSIAAQQKDLLTIIVPRHPERGFDVAELASNQGLTVRRRSLSPNPSRDCDIFVVDTIGELGLFYALSPVAFIGGSLHSRGGHNPVEAIQFHAAVITGPDQSNFADAYRLLFDCHGAREVCDEEQLSEAVNQLLRDDVERARTNREAQAALEQMSGALDRTVAALLPLLPPDDRGLKRAS